MFNIFKKENPKLEFVSLRPELTESMPMLPASKQQFKWAKEAIADYKKCLEQKDPYSKFNHISRCPGMFTAMKKGWIHRTYTDIVIKTEAGKDTFGWRTATDQANADCDHRWTWPYISFHDKELFGPYCEKVGALPTIVKIQTPWIVYIPKDYYLLTMPLPYPDRHEFASTVGFLDPADGPNFLNVQLFWFALDEEVFIPRGTPLCQYYLIPKQEVEVVQRGYEQKDLDNLRVRTNIIDSQYKPNYNELKNINMK